MRPGANGTVMLVARVPRRLLDGRAAAQHDHVGERDLPADLGDVEGLLDLLEDRQDPGELLRLVDRPVPLRLEPDPGPVGPAALKSVLRKLAADAHAVDTSCGIVRPESRIVALRAAMSASPISSWSTGGTGSCHSCGSGTHGPEVARDRTHVAVQQLEPGPREGVGELVRVRQEPSADLVVDRVDAQRQVGGEHRRLAGQLVGLRVRDDVRRASFATHCLAPAGLSVSSHSQP